MRTGLRPNRAGAAAAAATPGLQSVSPRACSCTNHKTSVASVSSSATVPVFERGLGALSRVSPLLPVSSTDGPPVGPRGGPRLGCYPVPSSCSSGVQDVTDRVGACAAACHCAWRSRTTGLSGSGSSIRRALLRTGNSFCGTALPQESPFFF